MLFVRLRKRLTLCLREVRDRFQNDPGRFLEFANDASNYDEALKMGLAIKRPEKLL